VSLARACLVLLLRHAPLTSVALQLFAFTLAVAFKHEQSSLQLAKWSYVQLKCKLCVTDGALLSITPDMPRHARWRSQKINPCGIVAPRLWRHGNISWHPIGFTAFASLLKLVNSWKHILSISKLIQRNSQKMPVNVNSIKNNRLQHNLHSVRFWYLQTYVAEHQQVLVYCQSISIQNHRKSKSGKIVRCDLQMVC